MLVRARALSLPQLKLPRGRLTPYIQWQRTAACVPSLSFSLPRCSLSCPPSPHSCVRACACLTKRPLASLPPLSGLPCPVMCVSRSTDPRPEQKRRRTWCGRPRAIRQTCPAPNEAVLRHKKHFPFVEYTEYGNQSPCAVLRGLGNDCGEPSHPRPIFSDFRRAGVPSIEKTALSDRRRQAPGGGQGRRAHPSHLAAVWALSQGCYPRRQTVPRE